MIGGFGNRSPQFYEKSEKGEDFDELPETYAVFITEHDVIGKDKPLYRIGRYVFDNGEGFDDGSHIL